MSRFGFIVALLAASASAFIPAVSRTSAFQLTAGDCGRGRELRAKGSFFDQYYDRTTSSEELNPQGTYGNPAPQKKALGAPPQPKPARRGRVPRASKASAKRPGVAVGQPVNKYGKKSAGNLGRDDFMDITDQEDAGFLPDFAKSMFYDNTVGGPQKDLEVVVRLQLFFAFFVLGPAVGYLVFGQN
uniref:Uncharacterized protein n=1 Tax=Octactis speculum TaxID=3111310 RepID=A0A7S2DCG7_9STRA|mmetsp:Transcript_46905/g.63822  ORF Transcript_46905/g.63822 Transcript_46905/m.63822 type:complete len:186 (+) Transcript_46905:42-599(+)|eukprot:CAMPEP_0185775186 /NCGR_PEP_ID=MMETSP1174-20130828/81215_1 /TAXON_ID=35687 /ORGANISM="Dictyocha speculum, Strain CCMP1381" /LENGTH=185 /DNA_ID=CAMNT_0028462669 /DNA_START=42 /DNA_END=599 /DNA_ORIENTATION=-